MDAFMEKYGDKVNGVLSGFDRLVFQGTLRPLSVTCGMMDFLCRVGVLLKDFGAFVEAKTVQLREGSLRKAQEAGRPVIYLASSGDSKEDLARNLAMKDGIRSGLICVLSVVEPCRTWQIHRNRAKKILELRYGVRKCLHYYHYWMDEELGFMHARIQTWFPFLIRICINGREWLARQMDRSGLRYERKENCFPWIEDAEKAQRLMDEQLRKNWPALLREIAERVNPGLPSILSPYRADYYWSVYQSEWATDWMFRSAEDLASFYPAMVRSAIALYGSADVLRFLGRKGLHRNFQGEVCSQYQKRPEGIRVRHRAQSNSVKVYDKQGSILRVETTINRPYDFKVYRPKEGDPDGSLAWRNLRQGVADLYRRAQVSDASNLRYAEALASIEVDKPLGELVSPLCRPVRWKSARVRGLRPWDHEDLVLFEAVSRGEFSVNGFRNRDLVGLLFPGHHLPPHRRRLSSRTTYRIRLLRAHGLIRKVPKTHRYVLTSKGREIITAILQAQHVTSKQLAQVAA